MGISLIDCTRIVEEIKRTLAGGLLQKIHQPQPFLLTFNVRVPGESFSLLISAEPQLARIHLTSKKLENPQTPYGFCQYVRSHLEGGRIESIQQEPEDRIVYITIEKSAKKSIVVAALTGNQSNVFVLNEERAILRSLKPSRFKIEEHYVPPSVPKQTTLSPRLPSPLKGEGDSVQERFPVSIELEEKFQGKLERSRRLEWYQTRTSQIGKALKQATRREQTLESDLNKAEKYREYQRYGELLKSQLHTLQPRQTIIEVVDYYDPTLPTLSLPLNELKDAVWNMEDYFRKYRKYVSAQEHLQPRLEQTKKEIESFKEELEKLKNEELDELVELPVPGSSPVKVPPATLTRHASQREEATYKTNRTTQKALQNVKGLLTKEPKGQANPQSKQYRTFESFDGLSIFVGKSARDNDFLTLKVAKPHDVWLHARGCPGSHVIIRLEKATDVPHETLRDAATLALFYSDLKKSGKGEVIHTFRKFVKKSKLLSCKNYSRNFYIQV